MPQWMQEESDAFRGQLGGIRDAREYPFITVDYFVLDHLAEMKPGELKVYLALLRFANNARRECHPTWKSICVNTGLNRGTVATALKSLVNRGFIERRQMEKNGRYGPNTYTILGPCQQNFFTGGSDFSTVYGKPILGKPILGKNEDEKNFKSFGQMDLGEDQEGGCDEGENSSTDFALKDLRKEEDLRIREKDKEEDKYILTDIFSSEPQKRRDRDKKPSGNGTRLSEDDELFPTIRDDRPECIPFEALDDEDYWNRLSHLSAHPYLTPEFLRTEFAKMSLWLDNNPSRKRRNTRGWRQFVSNWLNRTLARGR